MGWRATACWRWKMSKYGCREIWCAIMLFILFLYKSKVSLLLQHLSGGGAGRLCRPAPRKPMGGLEGLKALQTSHGG